MATKNGVPFRRVMVPSSKLNIKGPYAMTPKKITVHNTDNEMPAINEINYMISNNNETSYHYAVDEKELIQAIETNRNGWNCGDGGNGYGNRNTIGIEICRNYDRTRKTTNLISPLAGLYTAAEKNAIKVIPQICIENNIVASLDTIKKHQDWSGKWCPSKILSEGRWNSFRAAVIAEYVRLTAPQSPSASNQVGSYKVVSGDTLWSISKKLNMTVDALKAANGLKSNIIQVGQVLKTTAQKPAAPAPAPVAPKPVVPQKESVTSKKQDGYFYMNDSIIVRDKPSTSGKHVATYNKGEKVKYHTYHEGNGYVWLQYTRGGGKGEAYIPCREFKNGRYGSIWGEIKLASDVKATPAPKPQKEYIFLPANNEKWGVYMMNEAPVAANINHWVLPKQYGGLEYEVLGWTQKGQVAIIQTGSYGKVQIFVGPGSGAKIYKK